jgi:DNA (cytosine-5)-methyltransferase 1
MENKFNYKWKLSETNFTKDKGKVFSCFACGGGSTMGYKLAGFDVIGCNEIDAKMMDAYKANHNPKFSFLEPIQKFKNRDDLPKELFELDILDGSPPCSSFSMSGSREDSWGKEKKFKEGQSEQILDTLFFDFIDLANKIKPKVVIAENVKGLLLGAAKEYVKKIYIEFEKAGYYVQHFLLDGSKMGLPQRRERVFFIALRKDLADPFMDQMDMFTRLPKIEFKFNEKPILFSEIDDFETKIGDYGLYPSYSECWKKCKEGESFSTVHHKGMLHNSYKVSRNKVLPTIAAHRDGGAYHWKHERPLTRLENCKAGSYPIDYNFLKLPHKYLIGMSVPPLMTARIASEIYEQWNPIFLPIHQKQSLKV